MKKIIIEFVLGFALTTGAVTVMTAHLQQAQACTTGGCQ